MDQKNYRVLYFFFLKGFFFFFPEQFLCTEDCAYLWNTTSVHFVQGSKIRRLVDRKFIKENILKFREMWLRRGLNTRNFPTIHPIINRNEFLIRYKFKIFIIKSLWKLYDYTGPLLGP